MPKYRTLIAIDTGDEQIPPGTVLEIPEKAAAPLLAEHAIERAPGKADAKPEGAPDPK
jgi:hypothetical protein